MKKRNQGLQSQPLFLLPIPNSQVSSQAKPSDLCFNLLYSFKGNIMSNSDIVMSFIEAWNTMNWDAAADLLTDDIVWDNVPMETMEGKAVVDAAMRAMAPEAVDWVVLSIAENGDKVLTERIDKFDMQGGKRVELPVMGTFVITDGKISLWRDYFDLASFTSQMA
jgi:limonene-1,2-epoxide hydrolase